MLVLNLPDFKGEQVFPMLNCISMRLIDLQGVEGASVWMSAPWPLSFVADIQFIWDSENT